MGRIPQAAGETTVVCQLHYPATVRTHHGAGAMIAGPRRRLVLAETLTYATTVEVVTAKSVVSHPPGGIVGGATRTSSTPPLERSSSHRERVWDHDVLVIMTAEEMIRETDTGIADVDEDVSLLREFVFCVRVVPFCLVCLSPYS